MRVGRTNTHPGCRAQAADEIGVLVQGQSAVPADGEVGRGPYPQVRTVDMAVVLDEVVSLEPQGTIVQRQRRVRFDGADERVLTGSGSAKMR